VFLKVSGPAVEVFAPVVAGVLFVISGVAGETESFLFHILGAVVSAEVQFLGVLDSLPPCHEYCDDCGDYGDCGRLGQVHGGSARCDGYGRWGPVKVRAQMVVAPLQ